MDAFLTSTLIVALAEMGDKTQLLAILLASRCRRPLPIAMGLLVATLANHFLAALAGQQIASLLDSPAFRYAVAAGFLAMAAWTLIPDKMEEDDAKPARFDAFLTTLIAFFLVEIGDKTQIATIALGAQFGAVAWVTAGTTLYKEHSFISKKPSKFKRAEPRHEISMDLLHRIPNIGGQPFGVFRAVCFSVAHPPCQRLELIR